MSKIAMPYAQARQLADAIVEALAPACTRIEVAGSVRRRRETCGDIEIVCIPRTEAGGLFGDEHRSLLDPVLHRLVAAGSLERVMGAERYRQYRIVRSPGLLLDLFIVRPETWGVQLAIRTGPADFSRELVTPRARGGRLTDGLAVHDGRVFRAGGAMLKALDTPEERDFLVLAGGWYEPHERRPGLPIRIGEAARPAGGAA